MKTESNFSCCNWWGSKSPKGWFEKWNGSCCIWTCAICATVAIPNLQKYLIKCSTGLSLCDKPARLVCISALVKLIGIFFLNLCTNFRSFKCRVSSAMCSSDLNSCNQLVEGKFAAESHVLVLKQIQTCQRFGSFSVPILKQSLTVWQRNYSHVLLKWIQVVI